MSLAQTISTYLNLNILILIGFGGLGLFTFLIKKSRLNLGAGTELRLHYAILIIVFGFAVLHPLLPQNTFFTPAAKVWSASSMKNFAQDYSSSNSGGYLSLPTPQGASLLPAERVVQGWGLLGLIFFVLGVIFILRDLRRLAKIKRNSFLIKKIGCVRILASDTVCVPFSYWLPYQTNIVIPSPLISRREDYLMAVSHEIQHHRHGDTRWVYVMWALRLVCIANPIVPLWNRWISEIQEFACDEALVDQNKVDPQAYARCLIEVAQSAIDQKYVPVCATGLIFLSERQLLKRRIEKMLKKSKSQLSRSVSIAIGMLLATIMGATAYAARGLVQDRRVSLAQAQVMAVKARSETDFPIVVNDLVLLQLNRYIGTPEGREFMRKSLQRMEAYKTVVGEHLQKYGMPVEIMAVPIVESGYQNLAQRDGRVKSAGLWQIIPSTARNFGLVVDTKKDERLSVELSTDAALRLLQADKLRFNEWQLSALAYNMGERAVQEAIDTTGSRDAWTLIRKGFEGDKDYLPKLMAAILIMRNPDSVE